MRPHPKRKKEGKGEKGRKEKEGGKRKEGKKEPSSDIWQTQVSVNSELSGIINHYLGPQCHFRSEIAVLPGLLFAQDYFGYLGSFMVPHKI